MTWIDIDDRIKEGLSIIDKISENKFKRILDNLQEEIMKRRKTNSEGLFLNKQSLETLLKLETKDLESLIYTITMIITQAGYANINTSLMEDTMKETFNLDETKIPILCAFWSNNKEHVIECLETRSMWQNLLGINWSVGIDTSSSIKAKEAQCNVKLQLDLGSTDKETLTVQLDKQGLTNLYQKLEQIQAHIDQ